MDQNNRSVGFGGVIRDKDGEVHVARCCNLAVVCQPAMAEAMALRKLMFICLELELNLVIFEGNCLEVVKAANSSESAGPT